MSILVETSLGDITIDLFIDKAPLISKNFLELCIEKFYHNSLVLFIEKDMIAKISHVPSRNRLSYR